jgi:hypothetical protein
MSFFKGFVGNYQGPYASGTDRRSHIAGLLAKASLQGSLYAPRFDLPASEGARFRSLTSDQLNPIKRKGLTLVLTDRAVASSGESLLCSFRQIGGTLVIGMPSLRQSKLRRPLGRARRHDAEEGEGRVDEESAAIVEGGLERISRLLGRRARLNEGEGSSGEILVLPPPRRP